MVNCMHWNTVFAIFLSSSIVLVSSRASLSLSTSYYTLIIFKLPSSYLTLGSSPLRDNKKSSTYFFNCCISVLRLFNINLNFLINLFPISFHGFSVSEFPIAPSFLCFLISLLKGYQCSFIINLTAAFTKQPTTFLFCLTPGFLLAGSQHSSLALPTAPPGLALQLSPGL